MMAGKEGTHMTNKKRNTKVLAILFFSGGLLLGSGCEREGPMEKAGEQIDEAVEETKEALDPAGPAERAGEKVDRAIDEVTK